MKKLLFAGFGDLAEKTLLQLSLAAHQPIGFIIVTRRLEEAKKAVYSIMATAYQHQRFHKYQVIECDISNEDQTIDVLNTLAPDFIFSSLSYWAWWKNTEEFSDSLSQNLAKTELGPWLPMHLAPTYKLLRAVEKSSVINPDQVINAAFPDVVNPLLSACDLGPLCGIGNIANNVPMMKQVVSEKLLCSVADIDIRFTAAHYISNKLSRLGHVNNAPFLLEIHKNDKDVSAEINPLEVFADIAEYYNRKSGKDGQHVTAASAAYVLLSILDQKNYETLHVPGVLGLPGGYPVSFNKGTFSIKTAKNKTLEDHIEINRQGLKYDGIEKIDGGTVFFTDHHMAIMKEHLGYDCKKMSLEDAEEQAAELFKSLKKVNA